MSYFDDDPDSAELLMRDFDDDMFMDTTENNDIKGNRCFFCIKQVISLLLHKGNYVFMKFDLLVRRRP